MTGKLIIALTMGGEALLLLALLDLPEQLRRWVVALAAIVLLGMIVEIVLSPL